MSPIGFDASKIDVFSQNVEKTPRKTYFSKKLTIVLNKTCLELLITWNSTLKTPKKIS